MINRKNIIVNGFMLLALLCMLQAKAQVTIGLSETPNMGALLDLKEYNDLTAKKGGRTANKGLILPRVKLTQKNGLSDLNILPNEFLVHTGLTVYNMGQCLDYGMSDSRGVYVWDGQEWNKLSRYTQSLDVFVYNDTRDGEQYLYRTFGDAGTWMLENMRAIKYEQGGSDPVLGLVTNNDSDIYVKKYIYPTDNLTGDGTDPSYFNKLKAIGLLYNWGAATNNENRPEIDGNPESQGQVAGDVPGAGEVESVMPNGYVQGICPNGWHVPSDREWNKLEKELTINATKYSTSVNGVWNPEWETLDNAWRGDVLGEVIKTPCLPPGIFGSEAVGKSLPASRGGFNLYVTGYFHSQNHIITDYGNRALYRSSSSGGIDQTRRTAYHRSLAKGDKSTIRTNGLRNNMTSVRCKKNN